MHLVSCRQSTSGRTDLMNFATRSMRSRTELMFQVVSLSCMDGNLSHAHQHLHVMAGLSRASTSFRGFRKRCHDVDGRVKPGNDGQ